MSYIDERFRDNITQIKGLLFQNDFNKFPDRYIKRKDYITSGEDFTKKEYFCWSGEKLFNLSKFVKDINKFFRNLNTNSITDSISIDVDIKPKLYFNSIYLLSIFGLGIEHYNKYIKIENQNKDLLKCRVSTILNELNKVINLVIDKNKVDINKEDINYFIDNHNLYMNISLNSLTFPKNEEIGLYVGLITTQDDTQVNLIDYNYILSDISKKDKKIRDINTFSCSYLVDGDSVIQFTDNSNIFIYKLPYVNSKIGNYYPTTTLTSLDSSNLNTTIYTNYFLSYETSKEYLDYNVAGNYLLLSKILKYKSHITYPINNQLFKYCLENILNYENLFSECFTKCLSLQNPNIEDYHYVFKLFVIFPFFKRKTTLTPTLNLPINTLQLTTGGLVSGLLTQSELNSVLLSSNTSYETNYEEFCFGHRNLYNSVSYNNTKILISDIYVGNYTQGYLSPFHILFNLSDKYFGFIYTQIHNFDTNKNVSYVDILREFYTEKEKDTENNNGSEFELDISKYYTDFVIEHSNDFNVEPYIFIDFPFYLKPRLNKTKELYPLTFYPSEYETIFGGFKNFTLKPFEDNNSNTNIDTLTEDITDLITNRNLTTEEKILSKKIHFGIAPLNTYKLTKLDDYVINENEITEDIKYTYKKLLYPNLHFLSVLDKPITQDDENYFVIDKFQNQFPISISSGKFPILDNVVDFILDKVKYVISKDTTDEEIYKLSEEIKNFINSVNNKDNGFYTLVKITLGNENFNNLKIPFQFSDYNISEPKETPKVAFTNFISFKEYTSTLINNPVYKLCESCNLYRTEFFKNFFNQIYNSVVSYSLSNPNNYFITNLYLVKYKVNINLDTGTLISLLKTYRDTLSETNNTNTNTNIDITFFNINTQFVIFEISKSEDIITITPKEKFKPFTQIDIEILEVNKIFEYEEIYPSLDNLKHIKTYTNYDNRNNTLTISSKYLFYTSDWKLVNIQIGDILSETNTNNQSYILKVQDLIDHTQFENNNISNQIKEIITNIKINYPLLYVFGDF